MDDLPYDVLSFERIFRHLTIHEVLGLGRVNRALRQLVRWHCSHCLRLTQLRASDMHHALDTRVFPRLCDVEQIIIDDRMNRGNLVKLMGKHAQWKSVALSTKNHTRRAVLYMLHRLCDATQVHIHNHDPAYFNVTSGLRAFVRHNRTLHTLSLSGLPMPARSMRILRSLQLVRMTLDVDMSCVEFNQTVAMLPRTLRHLQLCRRRLNCFPPVFLFELLRYPRLESVCLKNCLLPCSIGCRNWDLIQLFCERAKLVEFSTNLLTVPCVEALCRSNVRRVRAVVVGELPTPWALPKGYVLAS